MGRSTKDAWLQGPGDLQEADVEDVPVKGQTVRVRGLAAQYSNEAQYEAMEMKVTPRGDQIGTFNTAKLEVLQFAHGVIEPKFTVEEARIVATKYAAAFKKVIAKIDELSAVDKEAIERAEAVFPASREGQANGGTVGADASPSGSDGSVVPVRAGA